MSEERRGVQNLNRKQHSRPTSSGGQSGLQAPFQLEGSLNSWMRIGLAAQDKDRVFNGLFGHFKVENLREAFHALDGSKATGIDGISKSDYAKELDRNLWELQEGLHKRNVPPPSEKENSHPERQREKLARSRLAASRTRWWSGFWANSCNSHLNHCSVPTRSDSVRGSHAMTRSKQFSMP